MMFPMRYRDCTVIYRNREMTERVREMKIIVGMDGRPIAVELLSYSSSSDVPDAPPSDERTFAPWDSIQRFTGTEIPEPF